MHACDGLPMLLDWSFSRGAESRRIKVVSALTNRGPGGVS